MPRRVPVRRCLLSRCMFCRRWMWWRLELYCGTCYRDALALAAELDKENEA